MVGRGLEIKTALEKHTPKWHEYGSVGIGDKPPYTVKNFRQAQDCVPLYYWFQCQWYMTLMDFKEWDLCVLLDSSEYREYRIHYDEAFMKDALLKCERFWFENILEKREPGVDWGKMVNTYLMQKHGRDHSEVMINGSGVDNMMARNLREVGGEMKELITESKP